MRANDFLNEADEQSRRDKALAAAMANINKLKADIEARNAEIKKRNSENPAPVPKLPEYSIDDYKSLLARHDWYYDYSDDHSVWTRGSNERNTLYKYQDAIDPDYKIWNEYAPEMFRRQVSEAPVTTKTGAGNVTTVGGKEIARSTPKIGGAQTTQYADGSIKTVSNTTSPDGTNIRKTQVAGIGQKQGVTNAKISQGNTAVNLNFDGSSNKIDPNKATSAGFQTKMTDGPGPAKIKTVGNMKAVGEQDFATVAKAMKKQFGHDQKVKTKTSGQNPDGIISKATKAVKDLFNGVESDETALTEKKKKVKQRIDTVKNIFTEEEFDEAAGEKDACYHKVKARYKVWPSAYASAALSKCRKVGADNWGNKSKK